MHLTGCPKHKNPMTLWPCHCEAIRHQEHNERVAAIEWNAKDLCKQRNSLRDQLASLQSIIDKATHIGYGNAVTIEIERLQSERDSALAELKKLKGENV